MLERMLSFLIGCRQSSLTLIVELQGAQKSGDCAKPLPHSMIHLVLKSLKSPMSRQETFPNFFKVNILLATLFSVSYCVLDVDGIVHTAYPIVGRPDFDLAVRVRVPICIFMHIVNHHNRPPSKARCMS